MIISIDKLNIDEINILVKGVNLNEIKLMK